MCLNLSNNCDQFCYKSLISFPVIQEPSFEVFSLHQNSLYRVCFYCPYAHHIVTWGGCHFSWHQGSFSGCEWTDSLQVWRLVTNLIHKPRRNATELDALFCIKTIRLKMTVFRKNDSVQNARFEVFTPMKFLAVLWVVTPCNNVIG